MNRGLFTGKAEAYAKARPGYPDDAMAYICSLVPPDAVFADIGAGTGKFTVSIARRGYSVFAVEPNLDMLAQLKPVLAPYPKAKIISAPAEATTLPDNSVDIITVAQALHWFDLDVFRAECRRILKPGCPVVAVYNNMPGGSSMKHSKNSTDVFYKNPTVHEFPNPISYTRAAWLQYMTSHSHDPLPTDAGYAAHMAAMDAVFERESVDGLLHRQIMTRVYCEAVG